MSGVLAFYSPFKKEVKARTLFQASEKPQCSRCHFPSGAENCVVKWSDTHLTCMGLGFLVIHRVLLVVHDDWKEGTGRTVRFQGLLGPVAWLMIKKGKRIQT